MVKQLKEQPESRNSNSSESLSSSDNDLKIESKKTVKEKCSSFTFRPPSMFKPDWSLAAKKNSTFKNLK